MKNKLTKILSLILITAFIPVSFVAAEESIETNYKDVTTDEAYRVIEMLGILPDSVKEKAATNGILTRAEFTGIIYNIATFNVDIGKTEEGWKNEFFGDYSMEETAEASSEKTAFSDVDLSMEFGHEISYVCGIGLMNGKGNGIFAPDQNVNYIEVAKTIIGMLGYSEFANMSGGYEVGVVTALNNVNLYSPENKDEMTVLDVCKVIYSAFEEEVMVFKHEDGEMNYIQSDESFINKWLELEKVRGVITDNGITALGGETQVDIGKIKIDDYILTVVGENNFIDLIGREVYAYYSFNDDKENELFACIETSRNKITEIDSWDINKYNDYVIEYTENDKNKTVKLKNNTYMIYNGKNKSSWSAEDFSVADGNVTVIENGSDYSVVIIEDYMNVLVSSYNADELKIYNKAKDSIDGNGDEVIELKEIYEDGYIDISWYTGEKATPDDIKPGIVIDLYKSENYVKMVLSDVVINDFTVGALSSIDEYEYYFEIGSGEEKHYVLKRYNNAQNAVEISMNKTYALYLNRNGYVVWIDSNFVKSDSVAYIIKSYVDDESEILCMKILNENGKVINVKGAEKINYTDAEGNKFKLDANAVYVRVRDYNGIITYKMNAEEKITSIEIPRNQKTSDEVLQTIEYNNSDSLGYTSDTSYGHFQGEVFVSDTTKIFIIPASAEDKAVDSNYKVGTRNTVLKGNQKYPAFKAYKYNANSHVAQFLVMEGNVNSEFGYSSATLQFMVVDKISYGLDNEDEECMTVSGWQFGYNIKTNDYITKYAKIDKTDSNGNIVSALEIATDLLNSQNERGELNTYNIQKGDIVRFTTDETGEKITGVQLLYGIERTNPAFPEGRKGWLVGTSGIYSPDDAYSNPFSVINNGSNIGKLNKITEINKHLGGGTRFYCGFVYDYVDGIVELTANDFSVNPVYTGENLSTFAHPRIFKTSTVITKEGDKLTVASGGENSLKTYKNTGNECSRMITVDLDNSFRFYVIINAD